MKTKGEIKYILYVTRKFAAEIKGLFIAGIEDIRDSDSFKDGLKTGVIIFIQSILALGFTGLFIVWVVSYLGLILIHILIKPLSQIYKFALRIWKKAHSFMPLPPNAGDAVVYCVANIFVTHPADFPVAGHGGGTASLITSSVQQRPGFNYVKLDVIKQSATPLNDMERERLKLLLQRYINGLLQCNLVDGIPQQYSTGGFPFLYIDEVTDIGSTLQIDVLWVGHANVERYIKNRHNPPTPPPTSDASDGDF